MPRQPIYVQCELRLKHKYFPPSTPRDGASGAENKGRRLRTNHDPVLTLTITHKSKKLLNPPAMEIRQPFIWIMALS